MQKMDEHVWHQNTMENVLKRHIHVAYIHTAYHTSFISHDAKINYTGKNSEFTQTHRHANNSPSQSTNKNKYIWCSCTVCQLHIARKLQPQNVSRQISSINRLVIHVRAAQKPLVDTLFDDNCCLYVMRFVGYDVYCTVLHAVDTRLFGGSVHITCFDFTCALNYSFSPHRFIFGVGIKLHIVNAPDSTHRHTHTSCITWQIPTASVVIIFAIPQKNTHNTDDG